MYDPISYLVVLICWGHGISTWGWSVCHGWTFLKTEKNCLLKVTKNMYVSVLCFMLKSVINSFEIDQSLVGVVCY